MQREPEPTAPTSKKLAAVSSEPNYLNDFWTPARTEAFYPVIRANAHGRDAIRKAYASIDDAAKLDLITKVGEGRLPMIATSAFALPVLSPEGCRAICARSSSYAFTGNDEEEPEHRIAEAVLAEVDPDYEAFLTSVLMTGLSPWFLMLWGRLPSQLASLQIAFYNPDQHDQTAMHIDRDSDFTAVISLNPEDFEGGGTAIADGLIGDFTIPPLPIGHALIFDGRRTFHRGLPTIGNRKLLVVWSNQNNDVW